MMPKIKNQVQLIVYPDSFGGNLKQLHQILNKYFHKALGGVHILPFYPSSSDRGFSPLTHMEVDSHFGSWQDIKAIGRDYNLVCDLMVNHVSSHSYRFQDFLRHGSKAKYANCFITAEKFSRRINSWPRHKLMRWLLAILEMIANFYRRYDFIFHKDGVNRFCLKKIYRPRPGDPFVPFRFADGSLKYVWCTFSPDQVDLNIKSPAVRRKFKRNIAQLAAVGAKILRLDAVGYVAKKRGTSSFLIKETYHFIRWLGRQAHQQGVAVLPEVHYHFKTQLKLARLPEVDYVYDFALPILILHTLFSGNPERLLNWLKIRPTNCVTVLDTHDGIGIVDGEGLLTAEEIKKTTHLLKLHGAHEAWRALNGGQERELYQMDTTYFSALGENEDAYIVARAIQLFLPGIPQIYYVGLLAGSNDYQLYKKTKISRDLNRHNYSCQEIEANLNRPVVKRLLKLMIWRNQHPAFTGQFEVKRPREEILLLRWQKGRNHIQAEINLKTYVVYLLWRDPRTGLEKKEKV
jgi:sucrose phosphorylase